MGCCGRWFHSDGSSRRAEVLAAIGGAAGAVAESAGNGSCAAGSAFRLS